MNLQQQEQFYQMVTRLRGNSRSRAASGKGDTRVTEMTNGLLVSKPVTKPEIIDLQEYAKSSKAAASIPSINKMKAIQDFYNGKH